MQLLIIVRADPDEPFKVSAEQIEAGKRWLDDRTEEGHFKLCLPFEQTGGVVILQLPDDLDRRDVDTYLRAFWAPYPLLDTITYTWDVLLETLDDGFDVLRTAHAEQRRVLTS